jgi:dolichyl-phosphate beta-glucosyltransferase
MRPIAWVRRSSAFSVTSPRNAGTRRSLREAAERWTCLRLIENPGNRGKGYSVRNGMLNATGELLLFSDADLSSPIEEAPKLWAAIQDGAEVAIGSRWIRPELQTKRQSLLRQLYGRAFNRIRWNAIAGRYDRAPAKLP